VISTSGWEPARAVPEQFDGAINWLEGKVDDGTFDCIYGFMEGGAVSASSTPIRTARCST
jgi:hypothetical protein